MSNIPKMGHLPTPGKSNISTSRHPRNPWHRVSLWCHRRARPCPSGSPDTNGMSSDLVGFYSDLVGFYSDLVGLKMVIQWDINGIYPTWLWHSQFAMENPWPINGALVRWEHHLFRLGPSTNHGELLVLTRDLLSHSITVSEISSHPFLQERNEAGSPKKINGEAAWLSGYRCQKNRSSQKNGDTVVRPRSPPGEVSRARHQRTTSNSPNRKWKCNIVYPLVN